MNEDEKVEELKKQFIVDPKKYEIRDLSALLRRIMVFAKISNDGKVFFEKNIENVMAKATLILISRYVAHQLDENISGSATLDEVVSYGRMDRKTTINRLSELVAQGWLLSETRGTYSVNPLKIEDLLKKVEENDFTTLRGPRKKQKQPLVESESSSSGTKASLDELITPEER